jgi:hypothetical protein
MVKFKADNALTFSGNKTEGAVIKIQLPAACTVTPILSGSVIKTQLPGIVTPILSATNAISQQQQQIPQQTLSAGKRPCVPC